MNELLKTLLILLCFSFVNSVEAALGGSLIKIIKETKVYLKPTSKSKVIADVDPDTLLVFKKLSPKGYWLLLEDEDGNSGWVRARYTDYLEIDISREEQKKKKKKKKSSSQKPKRSTKFMLGVAGRLSFKDQIGARAAGLSFGIFIPYGGGNVYGYEFGVFLHRQNTSWRNISVPLRVKHLSLFGAKYLRGPDIGLLWMINRPKTHLPSIGLGYNLGLMAGKSLVILLRGGLEVLHGTRASLETRLSWIF